MNTATMTVSSVVVPISSGLAMIDCSARRISGPSCESVPVWARPIQTGAGLPDGPLRAQEVIEEALRVRRRLLLLLLRAGLRQLGRRQVGERRRRRVGEVADRAGHRVEDAL